MASPPNPVGTWEEYFASMRAMPLHPMYRQLEPFLPKEGKALELGAGIGTGARFLLDHGLTVTAVDAEPEAAEALRQFLPAKHVIEALMQHVSLGYKAYDVVVAGFSLFFLTRAEFEAFWPRIVTSIKPGGLFMGQFLLPNDDWGKAGYLTHSAEELQSLFAPFQILHKEEVERDGKTSQGTDKHWHVLHVLAKKLAD